MKIKCIDVSGYHHLTIGKTYDVTYIFSDGDYKIINDKGREDWYPKYYFKKLSEYRNETINKLLAE